MSLRRWFRERMLGDDAPGDDVPPGSALVNTLLGRESPRVPALGEYDSATYPADLLELIARREHVARELLSLGPDLVDPDDRIRAIPRLRALLRIYPHPLVYDALINAHLDAGNYDEAKGVVFAARQRRLDCLHSEHPEIRAELDGIREWTADEIDEMKGSRRKRKGRSGR